MLLPGRSVLWFFAQSYTCPVGYPTLCGLLNCLSHSARQRGARILHEHRVWWRRLDARAGSRGSSPWQGICASCVGICAYTDRGACRRVIKVRFSTKPVLMQLAPDNIPVAWIPPLCLDSVQDVPGHHGTRGSSGRFHRRCKPPWGRG